MKKIAIDSSIPYTKGLIDEIAVVDYVDRGNFVNDRIKDCDAIIVRSTINCNKDLLSQTNLKIVSTATAGFDHIDTKFCEANGINWANSPGCNRESVAEYVLSALARVLLRKGKNFKDISCLGIVGVGYTGSALANLCKIIGIKTMFCDPIRAEKDGSSGFYSLEELAGNCDVISFHVPLNKDSKYPTYHMINASFLEKMQDSSILINACRGAVADTVALKDYHRRGKFSALIIDCWEGEPIIDKELLDMVDIATTHIAGFSADSKANSTLMSINNVLRFFGMKELDMNLISLYNPENSIIDLNEIEEDKQIETAIISTNTLEKIDEELRLNPNDFEHIRESYHRPREFRAYKVRNASSENSVILRQLGFEVL